MFKLYSCTNVGMANAVLARSPQHAWTQLKAVLEARGWKEPEPKQVGIDKDGEGEDATAHPVYEYWKAEWKIHPSDQPGAYLL